MWCLTKKLSTAVMVLIVGAGVVPLAMADFYVADVATLCLSEYNVLISNAVLTAAASTYECAFTGGTCQVDLTGKEANYAAVCQNIGGVPYDVDVVLDCLGSATLVTTGVSLTNSVNCLGKSCTPTEANIISVTATVADLTTIGQSCTGVGSGATPTVLAKSTSAGTRAHNDDTARSAIRLIMSLFNVGYLFW
jgi:hypothetical protein